MNSKRIKKRKLFGDEDDELDKLFSTDDVPHAVAKFTDDAKQRIFQNPRELLRLQDDEPYLSFTKLQQEFLEHQSELKVAALWQEHGCHYEASILKVIPENQNAGPRQSNPSTSKISAPATPKKKLAPKKTAATNLHEQHKKKGKSDSENTTIRTDAQKKLDIIAAKAAVVRQVLDIPESQESASSSDIHVALGETEDVNSARVENMIQPHYFSQLEKEKAECVEQLEKLKVALKSKNEEIFKLRKENDMLRSKLEEFRKTSGSSEFEHLKTLLCMSPVQGFIRELGKLQSLNDHESSDTGCLPLATTSSQNDNMCVHPRVQQMLTPTAEPSTGSATHFKLVDAVSSPPHQASTQQELVPGSGVQITKLKLSAILSKGSVSMSRMTKHLLEVFFDDEVLASSNYDGGGGQNKPLDKKITSAIKDFVRQRFPGTKDRDIVQKINEKCVDTRKLLKKKLKTQEPSNHN